VNVIRQLLGGGLSIGLLLGARGGDDALDRLLLDKPADHERPDRRLQEVESARRALEQEVEHKTVTPETARRLARNGQLAEALAIMNLALARDSLSPTERASLLLQTAQLYDPRLGLPRAPDPRQQLTRMREMVEWLKQAAEVRDADPHLRWEVLTTLAQTGLEIGEGEPLVAAAGAAEQMLDLPGRTREQRWFAHNLRLRIAQTRGDYPALGRFLPDAIAEAPREDDRVRLQLRLGDVAFTFLDQDTTAISQWQSVAENTAAHPYYRAIALEKLALVTLYRKPHPNHVLAPFPERAAVAEALVNSERLPDALALWRRLLALPLANWVKLDALAGMARACQSCGRAAEGYAILANEAMTLPGLHRRQEAELHGLLAELALEAGDPARAAAHLSQAESVPDARPGLRRGLERLRQCLERSHENE